MLCFILTIAVTLHWNPFWLYWDTLIMFVFFLLLYLSLTPLVPWIDFPLCGNSWDTVLISVVQRLFHSLQHVCLWWHSSIPFSTKEDPLRPGISQHPLLFHHPSDGPSIYDPHAHKWRTHTHMQTQWHMYSHAHLGTSTTFTTFNTGSYHIAANPVKKLCGERYSYQVWKGLT